MSAGPEDGSAEERGHSPEKCCSQAGLARLEYVSWAFFSGISNLHCELLNGFFFAYSGKITYYTCVPEDRSASSQISAEIVSQMSAEFDIDSLLQEEENTLSGQC